MNAETYSIIIFWSDEDEAFLAKVIELPGCMAHGETREEALREIKVAIENWLETARDLGREIPKPKHFLDFEKMADESAEETFKRFEARLPDLMAAAFPSIAPVVVEALAKEMAKSSDDVSVFYDEIRRRFFYSGLTVTSPQKQEHQPKP
jgi:predicted RNase H-like HicB family nuclease